MEKFDGFKKSAADARIEQMIEAHCERFKITPGEAVKLFPVLARRQLLKRFLAHTELFKMTLEVPGDIAELGVYRGLGLMSWANLLEAYSIGDRTKIVFGFDNWRGFKELSEQDGKEVNEAQKFSGGFSPSGYEEELREAIRIFDQDRFIPDKPRVRCVRGDIEETMPQFLQENPGIRFSLIHFDCDLYRPTKAALEYLWPRLSRGGVMLFDEYSIHDWPGETKAVDEFFANKPEIIIKKFPWTNAPAGYVVK